MTFRVCCGTIPIRAAASCSAAPATTGAACNSRNRVFVRTDDGIRAQAFDPAAMTDPKGILYNPVRRIGEAWVVSNGDQTDAIRDCFAVGRPWEEALRASTFKQDAPDFTPRISGLLYPDGHYALSILKAMEGSPRCCQRSVFDYDVPRAGPARSRPGS